MIQIYAVSRDGDRHNPEDRTKWGELIDGEIVDSNTLSEPIHGFTSFTSFLEHHTDAGNYLSNSGEPLSDPVAMMVEFAGPYTYAGVPVQADTENYEHAVIFSPDYYHAGQIGELGARERAEWEKYVNIKRATVDKKTRPHKQHEYPDRFRYVEIHATTNPLARTDTNGRLPASETLLGVWDTVDQRVVWDPDSQLAEDMEHIPDQIYTGSAVALLEGNWQTAVVVDSETGVRIPEPDVIRGKAPIPGPTDEEISVATTTAEHVNEINAVDPSS